jgi:hypothetical protein
VQKKYKKHMKKNLQEEVFRIKDMMKKLNESPEIGKPSSVENDDYDEKMERNYGVEDDNKNYWEKWDEDSDSGDEDIEHMRLIVRNMVDKGKIDDNEGYEMENILDTELEAYAEYNSGPQGSIDYKATLKNIRRYLNQREPDDNQMNNNFNHEGGIRFNRDEDNWQGR